MDPNILFAVSWGCLIIGIIVLRWPKRLVRSSIYFFPRLSGTLHRASLQLARTLYCWNHERVTGWRYTFVFLCLLVNAAFLASTSQDNVATGSSDLGKRAAMAATMILSLVILGGRTCFIADVLNVPLQDYYFGHRWLSRLAAINVLIHAARCGISEAGWTGQAIFGVIALILLLLIMISTLYWIRNLSQILFTWIHLGLAVSAVSAILLHLWLVNPWDALESKIPFTLSAATWLGVTLWRYARSQVVRADIERIIFDGGSNSQLRGPHYANAASISLKVPRKVEVYPGAYFYIHFHQGSIWRQLRGEPMAVFGWQPADDSEQWTHECRAMTKLEFLVHERGTLSKILLDKDTKVTVEGPYGRELRLHDYDTVCFAAEGMGIAAVTSYLIFMAERHSNDLNLKMATRRGGIDAVRQKFYHDEVRRVNLIWLPRHSHDIYWLGETMKKLSNLDYKKTLLQIEIWHSEPADESRLQHLIPAGFEKHYKIGYRDDPDCLEALKYQLNYILTTSPGRVAACVSGTVNFRHSLGELVRLHPRSGTFFELEHQPRDLESTTNKSPTPRTAQSGLTTPTYLDQQTQTRELSMRMQMKQQRVDIHRQEEVRSMSASMQVV